MTFQNRFYNTTHESGKELQEAIRQAENQTDKVLEFFKAYPDQSFTPFEVAQAVFDNDTHTPITSVRRSITNLEQDGKLQKTPEKRVGAHGRFNYCWKLFVPKIPAIYEQGDLFKSEAIKS